MGYEGVWLKESNRPYQWKRMTARHTSADTKTSDNAPEWMIRKSKEKNQRKCLWQKMQSSNVQDAPHCSSDKVDTTSFATAKPSKRGNLCVFMDIAPESGTEDDRVIARVRRAEHHA